MMSFKYIYLKVCTSSTKEERKELPKENEKTYLTESLWAPCTTKTVKSRLHGNFLQLVRHFDRRGWDPSSDI